ncbi:MAG: FimV/HubP family polar landmark protein [Burkholderiaceae bacterium]
MPSITPRRLAAAVSAAVLALGAGAAWSAGLGRLSIQSALGQPLRAEVEVTSVGRDEAASLSARLATPEAFRQAGLEFNSALAGLRFAVERRGDGRAIVRISSTQPINEPFVDLLLELNWATGKFVREYTFLLDPPELRNNREVVEGGNGQQVPVVPPVAAPAPAAPAPAAQPATPARAETPAPARAEAPKPEAPAAAARAERPAKPPKAAASGDVTVKSGDTLAGIAGRVKPEGVQLDQAIVSLYQANPSAFFGSIHQLKSGVTLTVPDQATMSAIDPARAREEIRVQSGDFASYRGRVADAARAVPGGKAGQSAEGSVTAKVEDKAGGGAKDQLRLSKNEPAAAGAPGGAGSASSKAAEQSIARDAALREQQARVRELEKNVGDLQKLVELKNKQLAEMQKQVEDAKAAGKAAAGTIAKAEPPAAAPVPARPAEPPKAEAARPEPAKVEPPKVEPPKAEAPAPEPAKPEAAPVAEAPKADAPAPVEPPTAEAPKPAEPARPAAAPEPVAEESFVDDLLSNPMVLPGLGAILALGAGYGWYAMRRRKKVEKFEDSLIAADGFATNSLFGSTGGQSVDTSASSFTSSTKDSGVDVHSTEVDPIAEAEVYIAYGRETQAEEILREALKKQPERQAIRAKLLEICSGRKDVPAFNALAEEMYGMTGGQNEEWPKVVTLGLALDPDNGLYTGNAPAVSAADAATAEDAPVVLEVPEPADEPLTDLVAPVVDEAPAMAEPEVAAEEPAVDFSVLNEQSGFEETKPLADEPQAKSAEQRAEDEVPALDFDLDLDTTIGKAGGMLAATREGDGDGGMSGLERAVDGKFELPTLDLTGLSGSPKGAEESASLDDLNIDLPALERIGATAPVMETASAAARAPEMDLSSIGLDLEPAPAPAGTVDGIKWQEMATKLDLASAYEEIGDKEGARELLEEVVKGGDSDQQGKARSMLAKIA